MATLYPRIIDFSSTTREKDPQGNTKVDEKFHSLENISYLHQGVWENINEESPLNLVEGFKGDNHIEKLMGEKIEGMVEWLRRNPSQLISLLKCGKTVFITFSGTLQTIMKMPYERTAGFKIYVERYRNIVFFSQDKFRDNSRDNRGEYMGEKLEQLTLSSDPDVVPDLSVPVPSRKEFYPIFQIELDNFLIIYGAQLDGLLREKRIEENESGILNILNRAKFIELKTMPEQFERNLNFTRSLKIYTQCLLTKVELVYILYRSNNPKVVFKKKRLNTSDLPHNQAWRKQNLVESLRKQLYFIESRSRSKLDLTHIFKLTWEPCLKDRPLYDEIARENNDEYELLPSDFVEFVRQTGESLETRTLNSRKFIFRPSIQPLMERPCGSEQVYRKREYLRGNDESGRQEARRDIQGTTFWRNNNRNRTGPQHRRQYHIFRRRNQRGKELNRQNQDSNLLC